MKSKKNKIVVLLIVLILIVLSAGVFAYVYLGTDMFKTDKQLFFKYIGGMELVDYGAEQYFDKLLDSPYESTLRLSASSSESMIDSVLSGIEYTLESKIDISNSIEERTMDVSYLGNSIMPITLLINGDNAGFQTEHVSAKFVATDLNAQIPTTNETLLLIEEAVKQYAQLAEDTDLNEVNEIIEHITNYYGQVFYNSLSDDKFSVTESEEKIGYTLTITEKDTLLILLEILEIFKTDEYLQNKMVEIAEMDIDSSMMLEAIDTIIEEIGEKIELSEEDSGDVVTITVWVENKKAVAIEINLDQAIITLMKTVSDDETYMGVALELVEEEIKVTLGSITNGLKGLQNITEVVTLNMEFKGEYIEIRFEGTTKFVDKVDVTELNEETAVFLSNDRTAEQNDKLWEAIEEEIIEVISEAIGYEIPYYSNTKMEYAMAQAQLNENMSLAIVESVMLVDNSEYSIKAVVTTAVDNGYISSATHSVSTTTDEGVITSATITDLSTGASVILEQMILGGDITVEAVGN